MPQGNRTGPEGFGALSGRGLGICNGYREPGFTKGSGLGLGRSSGGGMGRRSGIGYAKGFGRGFGIGPEMGFRGSSGRGFGRGIGMGYHRPFFSRDDFVPPTEAYDQKSHTKDEETSYLAGLVESMERELKAIKDRLKDLTGK